MFKFLVFALLFNASATSHALTVSSHNLQWFGLGGNPRSYIKKEADGKLTPFNEYREYHIRRFLERHLGTTDVFFFQEVVAVQHLIDKVIPSTHTCQTYGGEQRFKHQYVVACVRSSLKFSIETISDLIINGSNSRAGLVVNLLNDDGTIKTRLVSVHLQAGSDVADLEFRGLQIVALREWIKRQPVAAPTVIAGDFNERDPVRLTGAFSEIGLVESATDGPTLISEAARRQRTYDRFFISQELQPMVKSSKAFVACRMPEVPFGESDDYLDWTFYVRFVSDHCPITLELN